MGTPSAQRGLGSASKWWFMHHGRVQHVYQNIFRITANNNDRITASGNARITAASDY